MTKSLSQRPTSAAILLVGAPTRRRAASSSVRRRRVASLLVRMMTGSWPSTNVMLRRTTILVSLCQNSPRGTTLDFHCSGGVKLALLVTWIEGRTRRRREHVTSRRLLASSRRPAHRAVIWLLLAVISFRKLGKGCYRMHMGQRSLAAAIGQDYSSLYGS